MKKYRICELIKSENIEAIAFRRTKESNNRIFLVNNTRFFRQDTVLPYKRALKRAKIWREVDATRGGRTRGHPRKMRRTAVSEEGRYPCQVFVEFTEARIHERAVSHARNEPTLPNFRPTSAVRNFKRRAVSTVLRRLSDHRTHHLSRRKIETGTQQMSKCTL